MDPIFRPVGNIPGRGWDHGGGAPALPMSLDPQLSWECDYFSRTMNGGVYFHKEVFVMS